MEIREPVIELKDTKIYQYLSIVNPEYADISVHFIRSISPISADEALLLICSSYAHDLGMAVLPGEKAKLLKELNIPSDSDWRTNNTLQDFLRSNHSSRGGFYISENCDQLKIPRNLVFLLHKLMEAHNLSINDLDAQLGRRFSAGERELDLRQLACILCIADSLEFSETRVVDGVLDLLKEKMSAEDYTPAIALSYRHNMQSLCIRDGVAIADDGKIIFTGTFTDPDVLSLAHNTIDLIENWIRSYIDIDFHSRRKRLIVRAETIIRELNILGVDFERIGIRIRKEHVIDLIASNATWTTDSGIVIRELLQNSVEACRFRAFHSAEADNYHPKIDVFLNNDERTIELVDNGCGMSRNVILDNFLTVGNSRSSEPSYLRHDYSSLARFGIGFWSVFTIATIAEVKTAPFEHSETGKEQIDGVVFEVSIQEFKDYTVFKRISMQPGTKIKLYLKGGVNMDDVLYRLTYHVGCSEIPIEIHPQQSGSFYIPGQINLPTLKQMFGPKLATALEEDVKEFVYKSQRDNTDIAVQFLYRVEGGKATFNLRDNQRNILSLQDRSILGVYRGAGVCGFLFNYHPRNTSIVLYRVGFFFANALNPRGFRFTLNRLGLLDSPAFENYANVVTQEINNGYKEFLSSTNSLNSQDIVRLNQQTRFRGGETLGSFTGDALQNFVSTAPELLAFKLYKVEHGKTSMNCEVTYLNYNELISVKLNLWLHSTPIPQIGFQISDHSREFIYQQINNTKPVDDHTYLLETSVEADMLADNAQDCRVHANLRFSNPFAIIPLRNFRSDAIVPQKGKPSVIAQVQGICSGTIVEGTIEGANFSNLSFYHLVVNRETLLASEIKALYAAGSISRICQIANLLNEASLGYIDDSIKRFL
jgi:Histidine kinase-, DNA gyrase B-, and HSP90-like ATPase